MEKSTPHCRLVVVRSLLGLGRVQADFHKSMTTRADHRIWQDVYLPMTKFGRLYVKLTVLDDVLIVSFKEA